jgi:hypothetical protein
MSVDRSSPQGVAQGAVEQALLELGAPVRTLAPGHWGLELEAGGWRLDVGLALRHDLLRAQAEVLPPGALNPHELLHRHRQRAFARYSHADGGAIWVEGELPAAQLTPALVDRMLAAVLLAADEARWAARLAAD